MAANGNFAIKEMREMVGDLFRRNETVYWVDFLSSIVIGYGSAAIYLRATLFSPLQFLCLAVAATFIYRASLFMHEISHFRAGEMKAFKVVWNLLAGIPMLTPSFFYETHLDHHNTRHYGTKQDGEYLPLVHGGWKQLLGYAMQPFVLPLLTAVRFLIVTPLSFLSPSLRRWTLEHWSSFVIDLRYKRELRPQDPVKLWAIIEVACHLRTVALFAIPAFVPFVPWYQFLLIYAIAVSILSLNHLRTLTAHRYQGTGATMTHSDQLFDSNDVVGMPVLTEVIYPVGLRFHALHHLFPGMPYHNLRRAHLRLMEKLPSDAPYRDCVQKNFFTAFAQFLADRRAAREQIRLTELHTSALIVASPTEDRFAQRRLDSADHQRPNRLPSNHSNRSNRKLGGPRTPSGNDPQTSQSTR